MSGPPYTSRFKPGDRIKVVGDNPSRHLPNHGAHGMEFILPAVSDFDPSDGSWLLPHAAGDTNWISETCMEYAASPVEEHELAAAIASITGRPASNPNIGSEATHREISNSGLRPDDCPPGTVITIGHPANEILCVKVPDVKHATKNRWRNVTTGKLLDPEDFRAGWDLYTPKERA